MCLILFGIDTSRDFPFILAANRDEFYSRPTRPMEFWPERPGLLAGKDLEAGGTWFGVGTQGRFAALTNYRDLNTIKSKGPSRGEIIPGLVDFSGSIPEYLRTLDKNADQYSGFNLLAGEARGPVYWYSNQIRTITNVPRGIHGLSNRILDTPWPKVTLGKEKLAAIIRDTPMDNGAVFSMLSNTSMPDDRHLPDTGVGLDWERILGPIFIQSKTYGTRSSTIMRISRAGKIQITERTWGDGSEKAPQDRAFTIFPD